MNGFYEISQVEWEQIDGGIDWDSVGNAVVCGSGAAIGAKVGAAVGTTVAPVVGTIIGGAIGVAVYTLFD